MAGIRDPLSTWVVIATGQSLTQQDVDYVRGKAKVVVISNAHELAPWADILVSHDRRWWEEHEAAIASFKGLKVCHMGTGIPGVQTYRPIGLPMGSNSGLMGMFMAREKSAQSIILLGFDMHGTHYFGPHPNLKNTNDRRFEQHIRQFSSFRHPEIINCTPGSHLTQYSYMPLREAL